jgi:anti-sigma B factor antagonist
MLNYTHEREDVKVAMFTDDVKKLNIIIAEKVKQELNQALDNGLSHLILDLTGIAFIDSSGFGALVTVFNHAKNINAEFHLCGIAEETMELLKVTKLDQVFDIAGTSNDILSAL